MSTQIFSFHAPTTPTGGKQEKFLIVFPPAGVGEGRVANNVQTFTRLTNRMRRAFQWTSVKNNVSFVSNYLNK